MKKRYIAFYPLWYPKREHDYIFYFNDLPSNPHPSGCGM